MCYLVAKDRDAHGCFALKTTHGKHLVELKRDRNKAVGYKGIQLVTISRPTAYGEYATYRFVNTEQEFQTIVKGLRPWENHTVWTNETSGVHTVYFEGCHIDCDGNRKG